MVVLKFGGTSLGDSKRITVVVKIIADAIICAEQDSAERDQNDGGKISVVFSAMEGMTAQLLNAAELAQVTKTHLVKHSQSKKLSHIHSSSKVELYKKEFIKIKKKHLDIWKQLCKDIPLPQDILDVLGDLEELLHGIFFVKECTMRTKDLILSFGERLICKIIFYYLKIYLPSVIINRNSKSKKKLKITASDIKYIDARNNIITNDSFGDASVVFTPTYKNIRKAASKKINIITGFIASTKEGITTTLGRNGSDYTAALVGAALHANKIEIWTDVDGVLSADPRIVKNAFVIPEISYSEAMELSYFGAKVIHPHTVVPALENNIPIVIRNTLNPSVSGTYITNDTIIRSKIKKTVKQTAYKYDIKHRGGEHRVTGFASTRDATLLVIEGVGLSGNFYFLPRIFTVFASHHIKPLMITQSSSEHSICFVLQSRDEQKISKLLKEEFKAELKQKKIQNISTISHVSVVSVIGAKMCGIKGLAGRIFNTMGTAGINVIAIAQGSNEINISFVIVKKDEHRALQILHNEFF